MTSDPSEAKRDARSGIATLLEGSPPWSGNWKYNPATHDHLHALGVISANYNDMEYSLYLLIFVHMADFKSEAPEIIFASLDNARRVKILASYVENGKHDEALKAALERFMSGYTTCSETRNSLMHSAIHDPHHINVKSPNEITIRKRQKGNYGSQSFASLTLPRLRKIADEIANYESFGISLFLFIAAQRNNGTVIVDGKSKTPTLPELIPLPEKLLLESPKSSRLSVPQHSASTHDQ